MIFLSKFFNLGNNSPVITWNIQYIEEYFNIKADYSFEDSSIDKSGLIIKSSTLEFKPSTTFSDGMDNFFRLVLARIKILNSYLIMTLKVIIII